MGSPRSNRFVFRAPRHVGCVGRYFVFVVPWQSSTNFSFCVRAIKQTLHAAATCLLPCPAHPQVEKLPGWEETVARGDGVLTVDLDALADYVVSCCGVCACVSDQVAHARVRALFVRSCCCCSCALAFVMASLSFTDPLLGWFVRGWQVYHSAAAAVWAVLVFGVLFVLSVVSLSS